MYIVLISGCSGSGKSTIINILKNVLEKSYKVHLMSIDHFYYSLTPGKKCPNWDIPDAIDWDLLINVITKLKNNETVIVPHYDYITHQRIQNAETINNNIDIILLEGIFGLYNNILCSIADLKIYIDAHPINTCLYRRYDRDLKERGRDGQSIITQYIEQVLPGYKQYVKPYKKYADICYNNDNNSIPNQDMIFIQMILQYIKTFKY
jgi:uridine kinase